MYLLDFGVAAHTLSVSSSAADVAVGSWPYLAPERFSPGPAETSSDIYALACVLYECLTGQQAVKGDSREQFVTAHLEGEAPKPTDINPAIPTGFDEVIARGVAKRPEDRYQTARELALAARDALAPPVAAGAGPAIEVEFGRYRLFELLGQGSMGSVYRAQDTALDRDVAVKVLRPELATEPGYEERFRREAYAAGRLASPNIIPIYDAGEIDGRLYLVMPIIDGIDVNTVLRRDGQMSPLKAVRVVEQAAAALDAAHKAGLVHRDVKPSNLLMVADEFVYLIDFGLVQEAVGTRLTRTNVNPGTPAYMAPERFKLETIADARGDVYSLACVLYECLTGQVPFAGGGVEGSAAAHLFSEPPKPSTIDPAIPVGFDEVIARGMAKELDDRYQTANELAVAARAALTTVSVKAVTQPPATDPSASMQAAASAKTAIASPATAAPSPRNRRRAFAIAAAVIVVVAVAAFLGLINQFPIHSKARGQILLPLPVSTDPGALRSTRRATSTSSTAATTVCWSWPPARPPGCTSIRRSGPSRRHGSRRCGRRGGHRPGRHRVLELTAGSTSPTVLPFTDLGEPTGVAMSSSGPRPTAVFVPTPRTTGCCSCSRIRPSRLSCRSADWKVPRPLRWAATVPSLSSIGRTSGC